MADKKNKKQRYAFITFKDSSYLLDAGEEKLFLVDAKSEVKAAEYVERHIDVRHFENYVIYPCKKSTVKMIRKEIKNTGYVELVTKKHVYRATLQFVKDPFVKVKDLKSDESVYIR